MLPAGFTLWVIGLWTSETDVYKAGGVDAFVGRAPLMLFLIYSRLGGLSDFGLRGGLASPAEVGR
eukprot:scaffold315495_cov33-Prasinocladus_malaysianus.AAC.2